MQLPWSKWIIATIVLAAGSAMGLVFLAVLFFWTRGGNFDQLWMQRWAILLTGCAVLYAVRAGRYLSWSFAPLTFTTLFSGIAAAFWFNRYDAKAVEAMAAGISQLHPDDFWAMQAVIRQDASRAIFSFVLLFSALMYLSIPTVSRLRMMLSCMGLVEAVLILCQGVNARNWVPYFDNPSMGASFVMLSLFALNGDIGYYLHRSSRTPVRIVMWTLGLCAVIATHTSTPLLGFAGGWGLWCLVCMVTAKNYQAPRLRWFYGNAFLFFVPAVAFIGVLAYMFQGSELWNDNSRFNMWRWMIQFHSRQNAFTQAFGFGPGTARALMPLAQVEHGVSTGWFFWLHNDWLQIYIEQGWFGYFAVLLAASRVIIRSFPWPEFSASLGCFFAIMLTGFPLHWPVFVVMLGFLIRPFLEKLPSRFT